MQACRLSIAEAHPSEVVKALFDIQSHCAAFLLADSSCLLFSLASLDSPPLSIPPLCTDACFLSLRVRQPANLVPLPSSPSHSLYSGGGTRDFQAGVRDQPNGKAKMLLAGTSELEVDAAWPAVQPGGADDVAAERLGKQFEQVGIAEDVKSHDAPIVSELRNRANDVGSSMGQGFFLTVMAGDEKSSTFLRAWICHAPLFPRTGVQLEGWKYTCFPPRANSRFSRNISTEDKTVARLDIPHGLAVKIAASVNVLVIYSPLVGKVWIVAAKAAGAQTRTDTAGVNGVPECNTDPTDKGNSSRDVAQLWGTEHLNPSLCLIKCAVVDCNGPVYALHLSLQYLFLGQFGGLRVWPLRPLVAVAKRSKRKVVSEEEVSKGGCVGNTGATVVGTETGSHVEASKTLAGREALFDSLQRAGKIRVKPFAKAPLSNGLIPISCGHEGLDAYSLKLGLKCSVSPDKNQGFGCGRDGVVVREEDKVPCRNEILYVNHVDRSLVREKHAAQFRKALVAAQENGVAEVQAKFMTPFNASEHGLQLADTLKEAGPQARNGLLYSQCYGSDDFYSQHQLSQSSSSSASMFSPVSSTFCPTLTNATSGTAAVFPCGSSSSSSFPLSSPVITTLSPAYDHSKLPYKDKRAICSFFVPFSRNEGIDALRKSVPKYAVCIQSLSERDFIILDSSGRLHMLPLQQSTIAEDGLREQKGIKSIGDIYLKPLNWPMRVKLLAVLPPAPRNGALGAAPGPRKFWISDGGHSIHILSLPQKQVAEERRTSSVGDEPKQLAATQAAFTAERVRTLAAVSESVMMVLTQGSIIAYSMSGS